MSRVTFIAFLAAFCGPAFGATPGVSSKTILLGQSAAFTGAALLRTPVNRYVFSVRASYYDETQKIVEQLVSTGNKKIAVYYQDDSYAEAGLEGVAIAMGKRNLKIAALGKVERKTIKVED